MSLYIDLHALHTQPPNNINRDDTGAPKTATFGGVLRQRVSSQAWKRAIRKDFADYLSPDQLGTRTKRVVQKAVDALREMDSSWTEESAASAVETVLQSAGIKVTKPTRKDDDDQELFAETGYLLFLSAHQIRRLAQYIIDTDGAKPTKREAAKLLDEAHSVDIAMFGRMVADAPDYNVDAAVQVAHSLGVAGAETEFDFYTAVDDVVEDAEETGAGMIGTVQMMSSTLYRYATVDVDQLQENLGSAEAAKEAVRAFAQAFITSMPTGKQNTFANRTMPEAVVVSVRSDRPVSWVNAFEEPVSAEGEVSRRVEAARKLAIEAQDIASIYDAPAEKTWVIAVNSLREVLSPLGESISRNNLLEGLDTILAEKEAS